MFLLISQQKPYLFQYNMKTRDNIKESIGVVYSRDAGVSHVTLYLKL